MENVLNSTQISVFCGSIAMMLRAGVPLNQAVAMFSQDAAGALSAAAGALAPALEEGCGFCAGCV